MSPEKMFSTKGALVVLLVGATPALLSSRFANAQTSCDSIQNQPPCCNQMNGTNVVVASEINELPDPDWKNEAEVGIAINPIDPRNVVIATHAPTRTFSGSQALVLKTFYTTNGGNTWNLTEIVNLQDGVDAPIGRFDPSVAFDSYGNVYVGYIAAENSNDW